MAVVLSVVSFLIPLPPSCASQYSECQVGGNPSPNFHGCFIDSGLVSVPEFQLSLRYTYDPRNDNFLFRAFEGFSIYAKEFMAECGGNCPYSEFQKFTKYYDVPDYADKLISAAFSGGSTLMLNGNMDFALFGDAARAGTKAILDSALKFATSISECNAHRFECSHPLQIT
jgi:hypothetical protein